MPWQLLAVAAKLVSARAAIIGSALAVPVNPLILPTHEPIYYLFDNAGSAATSHEQIMNLPHDLFW